MAIRLYQQFWKKNELSKFSQLLNASSRITFWTLHVRANFGFAYLMCPSVSGPKALKKRVCDLPFQWKVTEHFRNRIKKIWSIRTKVALIEKKYFKTKNSQTQFCCLRVNLSTVKIWGQSDKFPMSFSFLQCALQSEIIDSRKQR